MISLTGESEPLRKTSVSLEEETDATLFELENILFRGTNIISGSGVALVLRTGDGESIIYVLDQKWIVDQLDAFIATIMKQLDKRRPLNSFQRGIRNVSYMMIAFMLVMVPIVGRF